MANDACPAFRPEEPYDRALTLAWEELKKKEVNEVALFSPASFMDGKYLLKVFQRECVIDLNRETVMLGGREVQPLAKTIILHYLSRIGPYSPSGKLTSYRELPNGRIYFPAFKKRVIDRMTELFHNRPQMLLVVGSLLGGKRLEMGTASVQVKPLPKIPITIIVWKADKDIHGRANVLFDVSAGDVLPPEDLAEVGWFVFSEMKKGVTSAAADIMRKNTI